MNARLPLHKAILYILFSLVAVAITSTASYRGYKYYRDYRNKSPSFAIKEVVQSSGTSERLPTVYLSEILGLSSNMQTQLTTFHIGKAKKRLMSSPVIKYAHIKKRNPDTLSIRYLMRTPVALIGDIYNGAVDEEGYIFPLQPYYAPKKLPEIYLGDEIEQFGQRIDSKKFLIALDLLSLLKETVNMQNFVVESIDVSAVFHPSLGRRSITIVLSNKYARHYIRLHAKQYEEAVANYLEMQGELFFQERESHTGEKIHKVIDLRIPGFAYVDKAY